MHAQLYVLLLVRGECCMLNTQASNSTNATAAVATGKALRCLTAELLWLAQPDCIAVSPLPFLALLRLLRACAYLLSVRVLSCSIAWIN